MDNEMQIIVIKVIDEYTVVINKGEEDGIRFNHRFLIYSLDDEPLIDPITKKTLGTLEIVKGTVKVKHMQPHLTTLVSDQYSKPSRTITKRKNPLLGAFDNSITTEEISDDKELIALDNPSVGDCAKITN